MLWTASVLPLSVSVIVFLKVLFYHLQFFLLSFVVHPPLHHSFTLMPTNLGFIFLLKTHLLNHTNSWYLESGLVTTELLLLFLFKTERETLVIFNASRTLLLHTYEKIFQATTTSSKILRSFLGGLHCLSHLNQASGIALWNQNFFTPLIYLLFSELSSAHEWNMYNMSLMTPFIQRLLKGALYNFSPYQNSFCWIYPVISPSQTVASLSLHCQL